MDRREFLAFGVATGIGGLSGCSGDASDNDPDSDGSNPTDTVTSTPTLEEKADYVVAEDGSGDYTKLQDALRIVEDGDTIGLLEGEYEMDGYSDWATKSKVDTNPDLFPDISVIGKGTETDLTISANAQRSLDTTVATPEMAKEWEVACVGNILFNNLGISPEGMSLLYAVMCEFDQTEISGHLYVNGSVRNSTVKKYSYALNERIVNSRFPEGLASFDSEIENCEMKTFHGHEFLGVLQESDIGDDTVENAVVLYDASPDSGYLLFNRIEGRIEKAPDKYQPEGSFEKVIGNEFQGDDSFEYFFEFGAGEEIYGNVFDQGDVKIGSDVDVYSREKQVGNYYSIYEAKDEDGDGILDLPRPIPGDAELTDQYPLANPDPEEYVSIEDVVIV